MLRSTPARLLIAALALAAYVGGPAPVTAAAPPAQLPPPAAPAQATAAPIATADPKATDVKPPDAKAIQATVDAALGEHLAKLGSFEAAYKGQGSRNYFQTLISHSAVPADGQAAPPDKLTAGPTDQAGKLSDFMSTAQLPAQMPYAFRTDVYDGPQGAGYVLSVQVVVAGQLWERSVNTGPETWRDTVWHMLEPER